MSERRQDVSRRKVVAAAGTAGALAATAAVLTGRGKEPPQAAERLPTLSKATPQAGGYRETDHVLRYYQTART